MKWHSGNRSSGSLERGFGGKPGLPVSGRERTQCGARRRTLATWVSQTYKIDGMRRANGFICGALFLAACEGRSDLDALILGDNGVTTGGQSNSTRTGVNLGGRPSSGGTPSTGGARATGGNLNFGGSHTGGVVTTGGRVGTGGAAIGGATPAMGGNLNFGGTANAGGTRATGGSTTTASGGCCALAANCKPGDQPLTDPSVCPTGRQCYSTSACCNTTYCMVGSGGSTATGGTQAIGGTTATRSSGGATNMGGTLAIGGTSSTAGSSAVGGTTNVGGTVAVGGATSANVDAGTGCTGSFEIIGSSTGLCIAKMATIAGPNTEVGANDAGGVDYSIDVTEVTQGQYDDWLATVPLLPPSTDANCGYVTSYAEQGTGYTGNDADHHPVVYVDWCDATAYCQGVGKRLCGAIGGGSLDTTVVQDEANQSQWYRACSSAGADSYPYGNAYVRGTCNGFDYWNDDSATMQTVPVGTIASCVATQPGFAGVYDFSGNVWEWEDNCSTSLASCRIRGGSFANTSDAGALTCGSGTYTGYVRGWTAATVGFRCCSE